MTFRSSFDRRFLATTKSKLFVRLACRKRSRSISLPGILLWGIPLAAFIETQASCAQRAAAPDEDPTHLYSLRAVQKAQSDAPDIDRVAVATTLFPRIELGRGDGQIEISFDELSHQARRFYYRVDHLDFNYQEEPYLHPTDYVEATDDPILITDSEQSLTTHTLYTHYRLALPNEDLRPLLSGNYRLEVLLEDDDGDIRPVAHIYFYVVTPAVAITASASTDTDIDHRHSHQQLEITLSALESNSSDSPASIFHPLRSDELRVRVLQNQRWDTRRILPPPTSVSAGSLSWKHCRELIFPAGDEYFKFETLSTAYPGMHVESQRYEQPVGYITQLFPNRLRRNYLYDQDQNGRYIPRTEDDTANPDIASDYTNVVFTLELDAKPDLSPSDSLDVYLDGRWLYPQFSPGARLHPLPGQPYVYQTSMLLKQGYYSYTYLTATAPADFRPNFAQTENEYLILVYRHTDAQRYDELIGWRDASFRP